MRLMRLEVVEFILKRTWVAIVVVGASLSIVCNRHHLKENKKEYFRKKESTPK